MPIPAKSFDQVAAQVGLAIANGDLVHNNAKYAEDQTAIIVALNGLAARSDCPPDFAALARADVLDADGDWGKCALAAAEWLCERFDAFRDLFDVGTDDGVE